MTASQPILDRLIRVTPLGLRFWDPASQQCIGDGLQVSATPRTSGVYRGQPLYAVPNHANVFVFPHLPGLAACETGTGDPDYWRDLPPAREFVIRVTDTLQRFLPFQISLHAPCRGLVAFDCASSQPLAGLPGQPAGSIPLFSSTRRPPVPGLAVLRADLASAENTPAAGAMLEVYHLGELLGRALADKEGHSVLYFPYPRLIEPSPHHNHPPLAQENWTLDLAVYHTPGAAFPDPPDLCALLAQPAASPLETLSPASVLEQTKLLFGQDIVLKTQTRSDLWIIP